MCLAIPGRVLSVTGDDPLARVGRIDFGGVVKEISLAYTPEAQPGEYVLAHVGFAMAVIDELEAQRMLDELRAVIESAEQAQPTTSSTVVPLSSARRSAVR